MTQKLIRSKSCDRAVNIVRLSEHRRRYRFFARNAMIAQRDRCTREDIDRFLATGRIPA